MVITSKRAPGTRRNATAKNGAMKNSDTKKVVAKKGAVKKSSRKAARKSREAALAGVEETRKSARQGRRTTLRVPPGLEREISLMAGEHGISENEAMIRLAARGAGRTEPFRGSTGGHPGCGRGPRTFIPVSRRGSRGDPGRSPLSDASLGHLARFPSPSDRSTS
jgi:hypothetical protein